MSIDPSKTYHIRDLAKEIGIDRRTIRAELEDKKENGIPFLKIGSKQQIFINGSDALISWGSASHQPQPTQEVRTIGGAEDSR